MYRRCTLMAAPMWWRLARGFESHLVVSLFISFLVSFFLWVSSSIRCTISYYIGIYVLLHLSTLIVWFVVQVLPIIRTFHLLRDYKEQACSSLLKRSSGGQELGELLSTARNTYANAGSIAQFDLHQSHKVESVISLAFSWNDVMEAGRAWYFMTSVFIPSICGETYTIAPALFVLPASSTVCDCWPVLSKSFSDT